MTNKMMIITILISVLFASCDRPNDDPKSEVNNSPVLSSVIVYNIGDEVIIDTTTDSSQIESSSLSGFKIAASFELKEGDMLPYDVRVNLVDSEQRLREKHPNSVTIFGAYAALEEMTIVADKELFGVAAGESLNEHFTCSISQYAFYHISYPDGIIDLNNQVKEVLSMDDSSLYNNIVPWRYVFNLVGCPDEQYDEIVFSVRFKFTDNTELSASKAVRSNR